MGSGSTESRSYLLGSYAGTSGFDLKLFLTRDEKFYLNFSFSFALAVYGRSKDF